VYFWIDLLKLELSILHYRSLLMPSRNWCCSNLSSWNRICKSRQKGNPDEKSRWSGGYGRNLVFLDRASPCSQHLCHGNLDCGTLCYFTVTQRHPIELHPKRLISSPKVPLPWIWRVHASMPLGILFPRASHRFTIAKMRYYDMPSCHMFSSKIN